MLLAALNLLSPHQLIEFPSCDFESITSFLAFKSAYLFIDRHYQEAPSRNFHHPLDDDDDDGEKVTDEEAIMIEANGTPSYGQRKGGCTRKDYMCSFSLHFIPTQPIY